MNPRPSFLGSLRLRLLFVAVIVEGVMLTAMIANSVRLLDGGLEAQARLGAERIAPVLHAALVAPLAQHDYATVSAVLSESRSAKTLEYIAVQDDEGRLVASSGWPSGDPLPKSGAPSSPSVSGDRYDVGVPVVLAGQELGRLAFGLDLSSVAAARRELVWQGMLIAAAEILLTAGLLAALGFWLTRDLSALTQESEAVSRGDFSRPPLLEGRDDLGRLSCAFNTMTKALRQRFDELAETLRQRDLATQALDAERSRLLSLLSAMGFGVLLVDSDDRIVYANPSLFTVFGLSEAPPGADVRILASVVPIGALVPPPGARGGEFVLQDGRTMTYRIFPVPQPDGRPARLSTFADATSSRASARYLLEAKTAAEAAVAAKESFLAAVSHEIRTPMNGIVGMTDLLLDMRLDPDQHRCAAIVRDSAAALLGVVSDILSFTALERGEVEKEESSFVPAETAEIVMGLLASAREAKGLRGSVSTDPSADAVFVADAGKIRQTLVNLVGNAVKFTFQGEIMVRISSLSTQASPHFQSRAQQENYES